MGWAAVIGWLHLSLHLCAEYKYHGGDLQALMCWSR
jgi:hypothetical protein